MQNFCYLNKFIYPCNAQNKIFIIQLCVVVELFSLKDVCSFIVETASFTSRWNPVLACVR